MRHFGLNVFQRNKVAIVADVAITIRWHPKVHDDAGEWAKLIGSQYRDLRRGSTDHRLTGGEGFLQVVKADHPAPPLIEQTSGLVGATSDQMNRRRATAREVAQHLSSQASGPQDRDTSTGVDVAKRNPRRQATERNALLVNATNPSNRSGDAQRGLKELIQRGFHPLIPSGAIRASNLAKDLQLTKHAAFESGRNSDQVQKGIPSGQHLGSRHRQSVVTKTKGFLPLAGR